MMEKAEESLLIDVEKILYSKNHRLKSIVPGFLVRYLKKIVHQDEINDILRRHGHLRGFEFNDAVLQEMGITYRVHGAERLPAGGRNLFVSNHPLGGLDGMVFIGELSKHYSEIKFPVNDILLNIRNYSDIFLPVNKHGALGREAARLFEEAYASDSQLLNFPAGICSRKINRQIKDLPWQKSFIVKAVQSQRTIVPCYFSGRNSSFFYNLSKIRTSLGIKANLEMLYLVDEMFMQKGKDIDLYFGEPVSWQVFDKSRSSQEWADWIREKSYKLPQGEVTA